MRGWIVKLKDRAETLHDNVYEPRVVSLQFMLIQKKVKEVFFKPILWTLK